MNKVLVEDLNFILEKLKYNIDFNELKDKHIFITGGTGLFGKLLLETFLFFNYTLDTNIKITVLTRNYEKFISNYPQFLNENIKFINGDIRNFNIDFDNIDYVIHAAASVDPILEKENPDEMFSIIVDGIKYLLKKIKPYNVKRILFTSSGAVYGKQPYNLKYISEDFKCSPDSIYGKAKHISENILLDSNIDTIIARCYAFTGTYLNLQIHYAIGNFILNCFEKKDIIIKGDGSPIRSYLYTADLIIWIIAALFKSNSNEIYNVGSMNEISILDLAKLVTKQFSYSTNINILGKTNVGIAPSVYLPDNNKIVSKLNVSENYTLENMIKRTIDWNILNNDGVIK
ncbi:NAD(P)-dependent oxidoreductase [Brachyspira pilosicoli]|uniref:NAD-dependent epimerase/dehydratase n=1 Tax=Brachyspira pilosicoli P43/6/78 TaxID=1042417 RepID=A0A3B6VRS2_BRAPL|nr:NAD(P)-dependent oxidoreductase [Brachyspira pilosicoli]AGA66882.1 NAD-dependent epimerase/dehydratase [Brachyspira pilosicoli P43/6/78]